MTMSTRIHTGIIVTMSTVQHSFTIAMYINMSISILHSTLTSSLLCYALMSDCTLDVI